MNTHILVHTGFDFLASISSLLMTLFVYRWRLSDQASGLEKGGGGYVAAMLIGAVFGGFLAGTANLWLSEIYTVGRSIVGAFAGAVLFVELFKKWRGMKGSTGLLFVPAFATSVMIGRWGCYFSGLEDQTYGIATNVAWAVRFGDGVLRHPVQLYESFSMLAFLSFALAMLARRNSTFMANGFYFLAIWYGAQRFMWEFLKPYQTIIGPFNLFHFICVGLIFYGIWMIYNNQKNNQKLARKLV